MAKPVHRSFEVDRIRVPPPKAARVENDFAGRNLVMYNLWPHTVSPGPPVVSHHKEAQEPSNDESARLVDAEMELYEKQMETWDREHTDSGKWWNVNKGVWWPHGWRTEKERTQSR